jgi:hypothetical protein
MSILLIDPSKSIATLKHEFTAQYPYLKIEFFRFLSGHNPRFTKDKIVPSEMKIGDLQPKHKTGSVSLSPTMTVRELEQKFLESYGLSIQVFRKSGRIWLETISTDTWTLHQQNSVAHSLEEQLRNEEERDPDETIDWSAMN